MYDERKDIVGNAAIAAATASEAKTPVRIHEAVIAGDECVTVTVVTRFKGTRETSPHRKDSFNFKVKDILAALPSDDRYELIRAIGAKISEGDQAKHSIGAFAQDKFKVIADKHKNTEKSLLGNELLAAMGHAITHDEKVADWYATYALSRAIERISKDGFIGFNVARLVQFS